jgi:glycosyltransferase involved in cell wall biosynthesis
MGAVTFSLDTTLVETLCAALPLQVFVESGTFEGDTIARVLPFFKELHTIELAHGYFKRAEERFKETPAVHIYHGASVDCLKSLKDCLANRPILYWLDAHWCNATSTAGTDFQCPLLEELATIERLGPQSVILIDDARLFLAPPMGLHKTAQWPAFDTILRQLFHLSSAHEVMVINDVLAFYPSTIRDQLRSYASAHGFDWLFAVDKSRDYDLLLTQLIEKEDMINKLSALIKAHRRVSVLCWLSLPVDYLRVGIASKIRRVYERMFSLEKVFHQYRPKPLEIPEHYHRTIAFEGDSQPLVSIVTPSFNHALFLERTMQSVLQQNYSNLEYIVQDGGSTDGTNQILEKYRSRLKSGQSRPDGGQANAINLGFQHASGEIMAWLNSDDLLLPGTVAYVARYFLEHPEVDVVYGHRVNINENDQEIGRWIMPSHDDELLRWADYIPQETLFWRRRIWEKVGASLDESFQFALDWDLLLRFQDAGANFARLPRFLGAFRVHTAQKTQAAMDGSGQEEMNRLRLRNHGRDVTWYEVKRHTRSYLLRSTLLRRLHRVGLLNI